MCAARARGVDPPQPCRYLKESGYCAFYDHQLRGDEDIRCYMGGWDCWEDPGSFGSVVYEGRWMDVYEAMDYYSSLADVNPLALTEAYLDLWGCDRKTLFELMRIDNLPEMNT